MSFRGGAPRGRGGFAPRGRGGFAPRGGRGGFGGYNDGPPAEVLEMGTMVHAVEGEMLVASTNAKVPYFNAPIFLENKSSVGKVDEILGPINEVYFTVKMADGMVASSFSKGDKLFIGSDRLLPLERFLPKAKPPPGQKVEKRGRGRGGARGGDRGGRGRGAPRGRGFGGGDRGRGGRGGSFGPPRGRGFSGPPRGRGFAPRGRGRGA